MSAIDELNLKFTSQNGVDVDRANVHNYEWLAVLIEIEYIRAQMADEVERLQARVAELEKDLKLSRAVVHDIFDDMECLPGCDSYGHETECPDVNPMAAFRHLRQERDELRRRGDELSSAILTINKAKRHEIMIDGDDEPCYWQRKEWVEWIVGLANQIEGGA